MRPIFLRQAKPMTPKAKRISAAVALATAIAMPAEGLRQYAYYDPVGVLTVCYGTTGPEVIKNRLYSIEECKKHLDKDMLEAINTVERCVPGLSTPALAAFGDAVYNLGPTIVCDTANSAAARYLKAGDIGAACRQLPRWNKGKIAGVKVSLPGLTKRRAKEMDLCLYY